eukprot:4110913-Pleurochrysis_carterae.AAC.2
MRRTGCSKLTGIVAVDRSDHSCGRVASSIEECGEAGEELANVRRGFMLVTQRVHSFEARVVIYNDEGVPTSAVD